MELRSKPKQSGHRVYTLHHYKKKKKKALNSSLTAILGTSRSALFIQWLLAIYGGYFRELNLNQMKNPIPRFHPHI